MSDVTFAVFGLGNRQYEFFCRMGKESDRIFEEMGGKRLVPVCLGDDDGTYGSKIDIFIF